MDAHKEDTQACILDTNRRPVCNDRLPNDVAYIGRFFERIGTKDNELKVAVEAAGFCFWISGCIVTRGTNALRGTTIHR
ncbi:MAG: IS110 family transposase [Methanomassiliicoccus sp.]|nr:IS110 family transposase [Methanomassiliicoccus sp.]